jgi:serine/threonine protein kinase
MADGKSISERMASICPELRGLPKDWRFNITDDGQKRIYFEKTFTADTTYTHPTWGGLPEPWVLKIVQDAATRRQAPMYYNQKTGESTTKNPRYLVKTLELHSRSVPDGLKLAARTIPNEGRDLHEMQREPISEEDIRDKFDVVHTIDPGDGSIGGMNGGVFVVRMKGLPSRIYIEKRFRSSMVRYAQKEIKMLERVRHSSLTFYTAAFIKPDLQDASLYVEFCDRGSLQDLMDEYMKRYNNNPRPCAPEAFVWHTFIGLCDGLAYLQWGYPCYCKPNSGKRPSWEPILHRDVKPDNVLMRSRHKLGSDKYPYCVLSDFGLACEDRATDHPQVDETQKSRVKLGTTIYFAPELLYEKGHYPAAEKEWDYFPQGHRHSRHSDLWALGCTIFNLCDPNPATNRMNHFNSKGPVPPGMSAEQYQQAQISRVRDLRIPDQYSSQLRSAVRIATNWDVSKRPGPVTMISKIEKLLGESKLSPIGKQEPLPAWATRIHEYLSKAEKLDQ